MIEGLTKNRAHRAISGQFGGSILLRVIIASLLLLIATAASASNRLELNNDIFVEKFERTPTGVRVRLEEPDRVGRGDRLLFVLRYRNSGESPKRGLVITNPLPAAVAFDDETQPNALLSVDNGHHWGRLADLAVPVAGGGTRSALPEDVTHIRWKLARPLAPGAEGKFIFRGRVR